MTDSATVSVTGTGRAASPPDLALISAGISLVRSTVDDATSEAAELTRRLLDAFESAGVAGPDLQTDNYSVRPEYDHRPTPRALVGYRVDNSLRATIRDLATIGAVIDAATIAGGDTVTLNHLEFGHSDASELVAKARGQAWAEAEAAARQLAELAGFELGRARSIDERLQAAGSHPQLLRGMAAAESGPPIATGSIERTVELTVEFELVSAGGVAT